MSRRPAFASYPTNTNTDVLREYEEVAVRCATNRTYFDALLRDCFRPDPQTDMEVRSAARPSEKRRFMGEKRCFIGEKPEAPSRRVRRPVS